MRIRRLLNESVPAPKALSLEAIRIAKSILDNTSEANSLSVLFAPKPGISVKIKSLRKSFLTYTSATRNQVPFPGKKKPVAAQIL